MNWFKNLKTGTKLFVGFGTMIVVMGTTIVIAYSAISALRDSQQRLFEREFTGVVDMAELRADLNRQRAHMLEMMLTTNRVKLESLAQDIRGRVKEIDESLKQLADLYKGNTQFQLRLNELKTTLAAYRQTRDGVFQLIFDRKSEEARPLLEGQQTERFEKMNTVSLELGNDLLAQARGQIAASTELAARSVRTFAMLGGLALFVGLMMTAVLNRLIARPLVEITRVAERMASGDLTVNLSTNHRADEVGLLTQTFGRMSENLRQQIGGLVEGANVLGSASSEIVASTAQLASSASESATAVSETTTTVEEVRQTAQVTSQKAKAVSDSAQKAAQISQSGRKSTEDVVSGMNRIRQQMEAIAASMVRLSEQSQTIGQIIATVEDLAAQSNLLAVNAAIEAAKAGEHGKGFGVVAQEVKSLAEQSRQATNQVRTILSDIQKATTVAVMATEQGSKAVEAGEKQTGTAGESIQVLAGSVTEAAQAATQIAASSQQQLVGMDQVAMAMENIKQASTQNVTGAKQLETAARNLNEVGLRLKQMVERYKI
ncbi:MAG TPA: methyl-accepting chemotaxis protein [Candidatus Binatia bacterium]|nr:methyl-accepting chemotaxis protein [Candidatus Binatia bacterium]